MFAFFLALRISAPAAPGQNALDFLNLPAGAYSASLGKGDIAGIIGPEAIFFNPGQLGQKTGGFASHQELLLDTRTEAVAAAVSLGREFTLGAAACFHDYGKIDGYSADNIKTGAVDSGDRLLKLALSKHWNAVSIGLSFSAYNQRLAELSANGWGLGAGVSLESRLGRLAITTDNIGPRFRIGNSSAPLPQRLALSAWLPLYDNQIGLNLDLMVRRSLGLTMAAGLEYNLTGNLALRAGGERLDPLALGFRLKGGRLAFDYSYIPLGLFGDRHIFSFSILK